MARSTAIVLSGGIGLGAYQAGAYAALYRNESLRPGWIAASSVGAVNAALIAGNPPEHAIERLRQFWNDANGATEWRRPQSWIGSALLYSLNWMSAMEGRMVGVPGHFRPRFISNALLPFTSLYDLAPMRARLEKLVDFERLNAGEIRITVATTDIESGEAVLFDTRKGDRICVEHLLASCGLLPEFSPVEIGGRLLGDGALCANAPIEPVFEDWQDRPGIIFVLDLYARDGERPKTLLSAIARKNDLIFGNQTYMRLRAYQREHAVRSVPPRRTRAKAGSVRRQPAVTDRTVLYLSYRARPEEAGPERQFDLSRHTLQDRWQAGDLDMTQGLLALRNRARPKDGILAIRP
jgi:NTE family protein